LSYKQRGDGSTIQSLLAIPVDRSVSAFQNYFASTVAASYSSHSAIITSTGRLLTWGLSGAHLGYLSDSDIVPVNLTSIPSTNFTKIAVGSGGSHVVILTSDRKLYAYGLNTNGQVGAGDTVVKTSPVLIDNGALQGKTIAQVECGAAHTLALSDTNELFAWGQKYVLITFCSSNV